VPEICCGFVAAEVPRRARFCAVTSIGGRTRIEGVPLLKRRLPIGDLARVRDASMVRGGRVALRRRSHKSSAQTTPIDPHREGTADSRCSQNRRGDGGDRDSSARNSTRVSGIDSSAKVPRSGQRDVAEAFVNGSP